MPQDRWIFHCDCNSFFASVELLTHPELRSCPVAVCGDPESRHGIILAKNEPAKKCGVQTAETIWQAQRKCPNLVLLPPHHDRYRAYSRQINAIYQQYTDQVEPFGIDESWLDVTAGWRLFAPSPPALADALRAEVQEKTGLTISVGVSFNKVFAKLGSDYKKPDATTLFLRENYQQLVWPQPVGNLLYVGHAAQQQLNKLGITTIGQLAAAEPALLADALGKLGRQLSRYARGLDEEPVRRVGERDPVRSVGDGLTFKRNLVGEKDARAALEVLSDEVATRLRAEGLWAGAVQLTIKDPSLHSITRQKRLDCATHLARNLADECLTLLHSSWELQKPIRMLTVTALALQAEPPAVQQSLFAPAPAGEEKRERLEKSMDAIRQKYGAGAISPGAALHSDLGLDKLRHHEDE